jgi:hypothetical protein
MHKSGESVSIEQAKVQAPFAGQAAELRVWALPIVRPEWRRRFYPSQRSSEGVPSGNLIEPAIRSQTRGLLARQPIAKW